MGGRGIGGGGGRFFPHQDRKGHASNGRTNCMSGELTRTRVHVCQRADVMQMLDVQLGQHFTS